MTLITNSLISFKSINVSNVPQADWIFFTSKNSVKFFFKQGLKIENCKVACVGRGTHKELATHTNKINFIGDSVNIKDVGLKFVKKVNEGTCVFPVSNISKRTIQQFFIDQSKVTDLIVYETKEKSEFSNPKADILIFTSPSNARAYFKKYQLEKHQNVISMGPSTGKQLESLGIKNYKTPKSTGELGLIDLI
ncbi:MAG: uroporphyrinogen-III synthase [Flavobacteriales bacterium]|nr:uroporphyrinogen-III synthase [Flavobacteriales bacterium]